MGVFTTVFLFLRALLAIHRCFSTSAGTSLFPCYRRILEVRLSFLYLQSFTTTFYERFPYEKV